MNGSWVATANEIGARTVEAVWRASWQGAIGIVAVWLACRVWRRIPSSVLCALWFLVCLKLIVALSPLVIGIPCLPNSSQTPAVSQSNDAPYAVTSSAVLSLPQVTKEPVAVRRPEPLSAAAWIAGLWLLGVVFVGAYSVGQLAKSLRLIRKSSPCTDVELLDQAKDLGRRIGLRGQPKLLMTNAPISVLTFGALRPIVLISANTFSACNKDERRMILAHELAHVRRRDAWLGLIPQCAQILFFFHPMVWLACREFDFARETACDEEAISCLQIGSGPYGRLLLKLGSRRQAAATLCTPGVSSHFHLLRRRIAMLDKPTEAIARATYRRWLTVTCLVGALCIAPFTLVQGQRSVPIVVKTPPAHHKADASAKTTNAAAKPSTTGTKHVTTVTAKAPQPGTKLSLHVFRLKVADAARTAEVLHQVLGSENSGRVAADTKSNSIVVNADEATTTQIANVIKSLDQLNRVDTRSPTYPKEPQKVMVYPLKYANAEQVFEVLHTLYGNPAFAVVKTIFEARTNSIIVTSPENRVQEVASLIENLDVPLPEPSPDKRTVTRRIKVMWGDPKVIVPRVIAMMGSKAPEYIAPDPENRDILVITTQENCNRVQYLVNLLDSPKQPIGQH